MRKGVKADFAWVLLIGSLEGMGDMNGWLIDVHGVGGYGACNYQVSKPNVSGRPNVSELNETNDVVSDHSEHSCGSEESYDSDYNEDSDFDVELENKIDDVKVDMDDFRKHIDVIVECVGCNEAQLKIINQYKMNQLKK
nr:hypothetical protein [Tanacetum cinerariifolium]